MQFTPPKSIDYGRGTLANLIERILKVGYLLEDNVKFIYSLLPDIENECIKEDLRCFLGGK